MTLPDPAVGPRPRGMRLASAAVKMRADFTLGLLDAVVVAAAYGAALALRFDGSVPAQYWGAFWLFLPVAVGVHLLANATAGLYGKVWRHASVDEARRVVLSGTGALIVLSLLFLTGSRDLPLSVVILGGAGALVLIGALRFQSRLFAVHRRREDLRATRLVVIGAGDAAGLAVREMRRDPALGMHPVAIVDEDRRKHGRELAGVPVVGGFDKLAEAAELHGAQLALLAIPSASSELVRRVAEAADTAELPLKVLPSLAEMVDGQVTVRDLRDLEISDLIGRQQVETDLAAVCSRLRGRRVLITGAGGSIGAEIARQVAACDPDRLVLLDHDETHLHDASVGLDANLAVVLADVRDPVAVEQAFATHQPDVVFHAAAHKHVPMLEDHPCEAVATNVLGTERVVAAALRHGVPRFVFISSDKAVKPSSVMGTTKRLGEQITLSRAPAGAQWCAVRFGNVLGSRGSVIPTFFAQIQRGGPVTVTDPRMTRYFMSLEEAVQLVLQAEAFAAGGEVFVLDMGEPVAILDLAERMIRLSGRRVGQDVEIRITGLRPGEKLVEELCAPDESPLPTPHPSIVCLRPSLVEPARLTGSLAYLAERVAARDDDATATALFDLNDAIPTPISLRAGETDASVVALRNRTDAATVRLRADEQDWSVLARRNGNGHRNGKTPAHEPVHEEKVSWSPSST